VLLIPSGRVNEPNAAEWITAISAAGALVAAIAAAVIAGITFRHGISERRAAQASQISAWVEERSVDATAGQPMGLMKVCVLRNSSSQPVYLVRLSYEWSPGPGEQRGPIEEPVPMAVLPPGDGLSTLPTEVVLQWREMRQLGRSALTNLTFIDAAGRRWTRAADGTLHEGEPRGGPITT
jgi:hypothetical protein